MNVLGEAEIISRGRITVPKKVRDYLGLQSGDKVIFSKQNNYVVISKK